jgi:hypothetical protein
MVTVIATMHACVCLFCLWLLVHKAHGDCDCCEAIHVCACLCVVVHEAFGHCDCCEAMHACVECVFRFVEGICSRWLWTRAFVLRVLVNEYMLTVIASRRCMHVLEWVFLTK